MIIYFADRDLTILGHASTSLPAGYRISDDRTVESVETGLNTFQCVISYTAETRAELEDAVQVGYFILKQSNTGDESNIYDSLYQIIETEFDTKTQEITLYAEDAGLDLINTLCPAVTLNGSLQYMMRYFLPSDWSLNMIDVPTNTRSYAWDGESTATERLMSVANLFGCELYYSFVIDRLQVEAKVLNVTQKRGNQEAIPQLRLDYDLDRIFTKKSIADLVTAFRVTGGTPEGSDTPINLKNYNYSYTDPTTGDLYVVDKPTGQMRNISAMARWSSVIDTDGLWVGTYEYDTTDKAVLAGQARAQLQRDSQVAVNYEVDFSRLPDDIAIGDRVNIIDEHGELYLEARLLEIETCEAEDTKTAVIGEYLLRDSGINAQVAELASSLASQREADKALQESLQIISDTVDSMFTLEVDSDVVLNTAYLTARLLKGNKDIKTDYDPNWFKWILRSENGEKLLGRGYTLTVEMNIIGYASTILCRFIRPKLYDLTDHNLNVITDQNLEPIQVSFAGIYNQPIAVRSTLKSRKMVLRATATEEVGEPTLNREVNLYERGTVNETLQRFWTKESGTDAGAHITEVPREDFEANPQGGNLIATTDGIAIRDGLENLASFGADGMVMGKEDEKHITVTPSAFNVYDEDGSVPFSVTTEGSLKPFETGRFTGVGGTGESISSLAVMNIYLRGRLGDNKVYFGVSTSGKPTEFTVYIEPSNAEQTVTIDGVIFTIKWNIASGLLVKAQNTNSTYRYIGVKYTDIYYETSVKVNDARLDNEVHRLALIDSVGTSMQQYTNVGTYGKIAQISIPVYNTNSVSVGNFIYRGSIVDYLPVMPVALMGRDITGQNVIFGTLNGDGSIFVWNTGKSAISVPSASPITLTATYIYK